VKKGGYMSEMLKQVKNAILAYDVEMAANLGRKAIEEKVDLVSVTNAAIEAIKEVGDSYNCGDAWLPDLIGASNAMTGLMSVIEDQLKREGKQREPVGTVVIGTVYGDIHSIGKDMVAALAVAEGFRVIDLGVDVKVDSFMEAIRKNKPEILAMSALLTTTAPEQGRVIKMLKDEGLREKVKVIVGGGPITADFARSMGADGYEPTAPMGVKLFKKLLGKGE
jgi:methanogenic corrinoid protein MtbC1